MTETETFQDHLLPFALPARHVRGRLLRLDHVATAILAAHDYPLTIRQILAEALTLTALLGSLSDEDGSELTLQAQAEGGVISLLACDYRNHELRGYIKHDPARLADISDASPNLNDMFGEGYLAITYDLATSNERYQGIVPLTGQNLSEACENYFIQSEQIPTLIRTGVRFSGDACVTGGLLVQHLPDGEEGRERLHIRQDHPEWEHAAAIAGSMTADELTDCALSLENLAWRMFHEEPEIRVYPPHQLTRGCRCSIEHFEEVLARFPSDERVEMRDENGIIMVDCAFCSRLFPIQD